MERVLSRRDLFLTALGLSVGLAACSRAPTPSSAPARTVDTAVLSVTTETTAGINSGLRNRLLGAIDKGLLEEVVSQLPNSLYRQYIEALGLTFFRENTPPQVAFANIAMPLYPSRVKTERAGAIVFGEAKIRDFKEPKVLTTSQDSIISCPLPFVLERNRHMVAETNFPKDTTFSSGLSPRVLIRYPKDQEIGSYLKPILPEILAATIIKEVATIGVAANYMQLSASYIRANNLEYKVKTKEAGDVEIFSATYGNLLNELGRFATLIDWSPFVLMVKAVSGQGQVISAMRSFSSMTKPIDAILATDFGRGLEDLIPNTFQWCIRNRQLMESVPHIGDFNKIP